MKLAALLLKTDQHRKLFGLLWEKNLTASVREFSLMSGLPYATAYDVFLKLKKMGLVQKKKAGRATLYSAFGTSDEVELLKQLLNKEAKSTLEEYNEMNLPLVGEFTELNQEKAQSKEELLVKVVYFAKKKSSLLRTLPLLVHRLGTDLDKNQLAYWAKKYHVDRELGFVLELTGHLTHEKKFTSLAYKFKDHRWSKPVAFLENESNLKGFQAQLVESNTPDLAKKWYLKLNMGIDSFASHYAKFSQGA